MSGLSPLHAGIALSVAASVCAAAGIHRVAVLTGYRRVAVAVVAVWALLPIADVQWLGYSESVFTALAAWSLAAVLQRRPLTAASLAAAAGLTRPTGTAACLAVLCALAPDLREPRRRWRGVLAAVLALAGTAGYPLWVGLRTGSPTGYLAVTRGWGNSLDGGAAFARWLVDLLSRAGTVGPGCLIVLGLVLVGGAFVLGVRQGQPLPLLVYSAALIVLAATTSSYFGSKPRYLLPDFQLLLGPGALLTRRAAVRAPAVAAAVAASALGGAAWLLFGGPP